MELLEVHFLPAQPEVFSDLPGFVQGEFFPGHTFLRALMIPHARSRPRSFPSKRIAPVPEGTYNPIRERIRKPEHGRAAPARRRQAAQGRLPRRGGDRSPVEGPELHRTAGPRRGGGRVRARSSRVLEESRVDVLSLPPDDRTGLDSLYTHDPGLVTDAGAVLFRTGKVARRGEGLGHGRRLQGLGHSRPGHDRQPRHRRRRGHDLARSRHAGRRPGIPNERRGSRSTAEAPRPARRHGPGLPSPLLGAARPTSSISNPSSVFSTPTSPSSTVASSRSPSSRSSPNARLGS